MLASSLSSSLLDSSKTKAGGRSLRRLCEPRLPFSSSSSPPPPPSLSLLPPMLMGVEGPRLPAEGVAAAAAAAAAAAVMLTAGEALCAAGPSACFLPSAAEGVARLPRAGEGSMVKEGPVDEWLRSATCKQRTG